VPGTQLDMIKVRRICIRLQYPMAWAKRIGVVWL
jgi:hypothetical protein